MNITRHEALDRSARLSTQSYTVTFDLTGSDLRGAPLEKPEDNFVSTSQIHFTSEATTTWVDIIADSLIEASLDGEGLDVSTFTGTRLPLSLTEGEHELTVTALCRYSHSGEGLHRFVDPVDGKVYLYSQFEAADARRAYACFEQPNLKATFEFCVMTPAEWTVLSNTRSNGPTIDGNVWTWRFAPTERISTYITAIVAGNYHVIPGTIHSAKGDLPASVACRQSMAPYCDSERIFHTTQRGFDIYEKDFGVPYAFDSYDQIFVPEYNAGAMENAGCVTFRDEYLFRAEVPQTEYSRRDNTILHELAHMWFGDLVTMNWWDDLWLNESFAEWAASYCLRRIAEEDGGDDPWVDFANQRKLWAYRQDQLPTTHPIAADMVDLEAVDNNFDGITYAKGASVLKALVAYVGEEAFLTGVHAYFDAHAFGNTELADLLGALTDASGRDLSVFTDQWISSSGVNTLTTEVSVSDGTYQEVAIVQQPAPGNEVLRTHHIHVAAFDLVNDVLTRRTTIEVDVQGQRTVLEALAGAPEAAAIVVNDGDLTYAKTRYDERSLETLLGHIGDIDEAITRAVVWTSLWDMVRDGELAAGRWLPAVLRGLAHETETSAISEQTGNAHAAVTSYCAPELRADLRRELVAGLAGLVRDAQAGSDAQMALADALISAVDSVEGAELVRAWLNGREVPAGLEMNDERRWRIVTSLARMGSLSQVELDAQLARDNTISGRERAAAVTTAWADRHHKEEAWTALTTEPTMTNGMLEKMVSQFWLYGQEDLVSGFDDAYLDLIYEISDAAGVWKPRGITMAKRALIGLFPVTYASSDFIDKLDRTLAERPVKPHVARLVSEVRANALRALRAQEASRAC